MEVPQVTASSSLFPFPGGSSHISLQAVMQQLGTKLRDSSMGSSVAASPSAPCGRFQPGAHVENPVQVLAQAAGWPEAKAGLCTQQKHRSQGAPPDSGH